MDTMLVCGHTYLILVFGGTPGSDKMIIGRARFMKQFLSLSNGVFCAITFISSKEALR